MSDDKSTDGTSRAKLARKMLAGLDDGFHYSTLAYDDEGDPIEVVWNYDRHPGQPGHNDDFTDRKTSERRRDLSIEHQQQFDDGETEQSTLPMTGGGDR